MLWTKIIKEYASGEHILSLVESTYPDNSNSYMLIVKSSTYDLEIKCVDANSMNELFAKIHAGELSISNVKHK